MNCTHCQDSGTFRPKDGPPEVCTCVNARARRYVLAGNIGDLEAAEGDLKEAILAEFRNQLPYDADWNGEVLHVVAIGTITPTPITRLMDLIKLAKFNPEAAA